MKYFILFCYFVCQGSAFATAPDWSEGAPIPPGGRPNPYGLSESERVKAVEAGRGLAISYPVSVTGLLPPYVPIRDLLRDGQSNPLRELFQFFFEAFRGWHSLNDALAWVGLHPFPAESETGIYTVPYPNGKRPNYPMGLSFVEKHNTTGFTLSCAECHSSNLFGKTVLGLTNRFPRANETFVLAKLTAAATDPGLFQAFSGASADDMVLFNELKKNIRSVGPIKPIQLGLDTSLAQVALSLAHRNQDAFATKNPDLESSPRADFLARTPADSKPAVWWNLKYKDRWLSDGSVVSGNPIFTNLLWNEVGRGADLHELEAWLNNNGETIKNLTTAVFSAEAPRFTDFFSAESLDLEGAKRGEKLFLAHCAGCHGTYEKVWSRPGSEKLAFVEQMKTSLVTYRPHTKVVDVGTDPHRYQGMQSLAQLNALAISQQNGTVIKPQSGYVPPPLVGIWARWPYFHNNSVPSLCAVLTPSSERPASYFAGEANDPDRDFDRECNGYPIDQATPETWKRQEFYYDTSRTGMSNSGHDEDIFIKDGREILSAQDKKDLILFLQTL